MAEDLPTTSSDAPPSSPPRLNPADVTRRSFATVRRGFDPHEVTAYLQLIAQELSAWDRWDQEQQRRVSEAEALAANPEIDENRLTAALGQRSAQVLRNAHDEAARILRTSEENASAVTREAQQQATDIQVAAEAAGAERIAEAELAAAALRQQIQQDIQDILDTARADGDALIARARERGRTMIEQAQDTRRRMGTEMSQRRRALLVQIEQLRAARDQLARSVLGVRTTVEEIVNGLARADDDARAAAAAVTQRQMVELSERDHELPAAGPGMEPSVVAVEDEEWEEPDDSRPTTTGISVGEIDVEVHTPEPPEPVRPVEQDEAPTAAIDDGADAVETRSDVEDIEDTADTGDTEDGVQPNARVEELFARIRAGHTEGDELTVTESVVGVVSIPGDEVAETEVTDEESEDGDPEEDAPRLSPEDTRLLEQRAALLDPVVARMARRLKRSLQDDQNQLLHRLRNSSNGDRDLLASEDEQRRGLSGAAGGFLAEAYEAGVAFARSHGESGTVAERAPAVDKSVVDEGAESLAATVVTLLRRRLLGEEDGEAFGSDPEEAAERVSAAYREWRGERIERLVGDHALGVFSSGVLATVRTTSAVRWIIGGSDAGCADCDDNALADGVKAGDRFPTGHRHPPAHAGCRCLVVPTRA
jgi:DivIVA domain-containing protein